MKRNHARSVSESNWIRVVKVINEDGKLREHCAHVHFRCNRGDIAIRKASPTNCRAPVHMYPSDIIYKYLLSVLIIEYNIILIIRET